MIALDLFAGTGWGVACAALGIDEYGVELMPEARATREANGMTNLYADVWDGLEGVHDVPPYSLLIASPPCQTFSVAGKGAGRAALDEVIGLIDSRAYLDVRDLRAFGEAHDMRTALVLTPLAHIVRDAPLYVVLEQVPPVLPVWERYAVELRKWGYSVVTGILNSEQYGVAQTRKRAILIARADGVEARMPTPTHSRFYSRDKARLDSGVLPWVTMADRLGWGMTERPYMSVASGTEAGGGTDPAALGSGARRTVQAEREAGRWAVLESAQSIGGGKRATREQDEPAVTMTSSQRSARWLRSNYSGGGARGATAQERGRTMRAEDEPSVAVTSKAHTWVTNGHRENSAVRSVDEPSPTVAVAHDSASFRRVTPDGPLRVTIAEAAALQSYPDDFDWTTGPGGKVLTKTKAFLQVGNAVPPLLAQAILATLIGDAHE